MYVIYIMYTWFERFLAGSVGRWVGGWVGGVSAIFFTVLYLLDQRPHEAAKGTVRLILSDETIAHLSSRHGYSFCMLCGWWLTGLGARHAYTCVDTAQCGLILSYTK